MKGTTQTSAKTEDIKRAKQPHKPDGPEKISSPSDHILSLQRTIGNQAVESLLQGYARKSADSARAAEQPASKPIPASGEPAPSETPSHESSPGAMGQQSLKAWRASNDLWYFNGEQHQDPLPTHVSLKADAKPSGTFLWSVAGGNDKAELAGGSSDGTHAVKRDDNRVEIKSIAGSQGADDVSVRVSHLATDGTPTGTYEGNLGVRTPAGTRKAQEQTTHITSSSSAAAYPALTEEEGGGTAPVEEEAEAGPGMAAPAAPKSLAAKGITHNADKTYGYLSHIKYEVLDDKGAPIKGFDVNEQWSTGVVNDNKTCNWPRGAPGGLTSPSTMFEDLIGAVGAGGVPAPTGPGTPLGTTKEQHWGQDWYIGSTTPGKGTKVQTNTLQKYLDHATHENIKSPP